MITLSGWYNYLVITLSDFHSSLIYFKLKQCKIKNTYLLFSLKMFWILLENVAQVLTNFSEYYSAPRICENLESPVASFSTYYSL